MKALLPWLLSVTLGFSAGTNRSTLSREPGATYLEDVLVPGQKAILKVVHPAQIYYQLDGKRVLGTLVPGLPAEIIAISDRAYKVRAKAAHADVSGWVTPKALEPHNEEEFVRIVKQLRERQVLVEQLVREKKIALGMTAREVKLSLGEPDRVSSTIDEKGRREIFEFVSYKRIPQYGTALDAYGRPYQTVTWVKVETGKSVVEIINDSVTSIQNTEGSPNLSSPVAIAPPPALAF